MKMNKTMLSTMEIFSLQIHLHWNIQEKIYEKSVLEKIQSSLTICHLTGKSMCNLQFSVLNIMIQII